MKSPDRNGIEFETWPVSIVFYKIRLDLFDTWQGWVCERKELTVAGEEFGAQGTRAASGYVLFHEGVVGSQLQRYFLLTVSYRFFRHKFADDEYFWLFDGMEEAGRFRRDFEFAVGRSFPDEAILSLLGNEGVIVWHGEFFAKVSQFDNDAVQIYELIGCTLEYPDVLTVEDFLVECLELIDTNQGRLIFGHADSLDIIKCHEPREIIIYFGDGYRVRKLLKVPVYVLIARIAVPGLVYTGQE